VSEAGARLTPYELALPPEEFEERVFPALAAEAAAAGLEPARREHFHFLGEAARALELLAPEEAPPELREQLRSFLFHGFNFWSGGRRLLYLEPALARFLVESPHPLAEWEPRLPAASLYLQLPPNLFWASVAEGAQSEPVDGFFVTAGDAPDPIGARFRTITALMVLGVRRERAGFSVVEVETQVGPELDRGWLDADARPGGRDFASALPGGEMAGLYSLLTSAEVLKLLFRALRHVDLHPECVESLPPAERRRAERPQSAPLTSLPWSCVRLTGPA
jgi:hypothetical protein